MKKILFINFLILFLFMLFQPFAIAKTKLYNISQDSQGIYVIKIDTEKAKKNLVPYISDELETNLDVYNKTNAKLAVNAGFFDPKNKKTVSYVVMDYKTVLDPNNNENLINNEALKPYMNKILNRSEFRILEDVQGKLYYDIANHSDEIKEGFKLKHSIQAGPMLTPDLKLEEEFFIVKKDGKIVSESASCLHKYARTAVGIKENNVYLFIATNENPMSLEELSLLTQKWGMEKAMAFDGGGSTSFDSPELHIISEKDNQARKLKSFLILQNQKKLHDKKIVLNIHNIKLKKKK